MKYKNIVFDFGNVLATFDSTYIISHYCSTAEDIDILKKAFFYDWARVDSGDIEYEDHMRQVRALIPDRLQPALERVSKSWYQHLIPIQETWDLVHKLKNKGYSLYILSNASVIFATNSSFYEITKEFDGAVFSAPVKMVKPDPDIYRYLFCTWGLDPKECLFIDDREENILAGRALGMEGIVFTRDVIPSLRQKLL